MFSFHPDRPGTDTTGSPSTAVRRGAKAIVWSASGTLLVKEEHGDGTTFWTLPGGGVNPEESAAAGLKRELREELQCDAVLGDVISEFWYAHSSSPDTVTRYAVFSAAVLSEITPVRGEGILDAAWLDPDDLPAATLPQVCWLVRQCERSTGVQRRDRPGRPRG